MDVDGEFFKDERRSGMTTTGTTSTFWCGASDVGAAGTDISGAMFLRSSSVIRAALCTNRCCVSGPEAIDACSNFVTGELAERNENRFSVCRKIGFVDRTGSTITASTVDVVDTPENL